MRQTHTTRELRTVPDGLRAWAKGIYPLEAGVELLLRVCEGRFARPGNPWVEPGADPGWWWIDIDQLTEDNLGAVSGGEARILRIAASLLGGPSVNLYETIPGLDRELADLVLAAVAHACGSHEHAGGLVPDPDGRYLDSTGARVSFSRLGSLHAWPSQNS